jgi:hypothetical protein
MAFFQRSAWAAKFDGGFDSYERSATRRLKRKERSPMAKSIVYPADRISGRANSGRLTPLIDLTPDNDAGCGTQGKVQRYLARRCPYRGAYADSDGGPHAHGFHLGFHLD